MKHVHHLKPTWIIVMSPADEQGWYRVCLWARCLTCGLEGAFAAEQSQNHAEGRLLEPGE